MEWTPGPSNSVAMCQLSMAIEQSWPLTEAWESPTGAGDLALKLTGFLLAFGGEPVVAGEPRHAWRWTLW